MQTSIIATLGPATSTYETIYQLAQNGVEMFRLNTSHGTIEAHTEYIKHIHIAAQELKKRLNIMVDLQGPKIRIGNLEDPVLIKPDDYIFLSSHPEDIGCIPVDCENFEEIIHTGDKILIDDGKVCLEVLKIYDNIIQTVVIYGSEISSRKGINLPGTTTNLKAVTDRDLTYIEFAVKNKVDYIALSFVRSADDIREARTHIDKLGGNIPIIAKIEKPQAVKNLDEIIETANGVMIARGDLGIEIPIEQVPIIQKNIIFKCIGKFCPCIVATQMLESMTNNPLPTRAEVSDVANAIFDGADAVMLSAETSVGKYPIESVKMMNKIITSTEDYIH